MILICPDSFKDAITSLEACLAIARGIESSSPELNYRIFPVSDGGEGFTEVLNFHLDLAHISCNTTDPLGRPIETEILYDSTKKRAFFAMSQAAGLELLSQDERNPLETTTYGVGNLIKACTSAGAKEILIGVGGSATNDGGIGMATALGWKFFDQDGESISPNGKNLLPVKQIVAPIHNILNDINVTLLCDVDNPLLGPRGATHTYAGQKGATTQGTALLEEGMSNLNYLFQDQLGKDLANVPNAGAAGGFGAGAVAFLNGTLESGINKMIELTGFWRHVATASLVLTGEGRLDAQTASGKLIHGIASISQERNVPVVAFCGQVKANSNELKSLGLYRAYCISEDESDITVAIRNTSALLEKSVEIELPDVMRGISPRS